MLLKLPMGPLEANCYLLGADGTDAALAIDPSCAEATLVALRQNGRRLTHILLTHRHYDHLAGVAELKKATGARVLIHPLDAEGLRDANAAQAAWMGAELTPCEPTGFLNDGDTVTAAGMTLRVLHTPGHTAGGVTLVSDALRCAFTGDTVFCEGVGRTDLPTGSMAELMRSLERILALPPDYTLHPGHGEDTTVSHENAYNPMLRYRRNPWFN